MPALGGDQMMALPGLSFVRGWAVGALQTVVWRVAAGSFWLVMACLAQARIVQAEVPDRDLDRLKSLVTTLALERDAADAIRRKDTRTLKRIAGDITRTDARILAAHATLDRSRSGTQSLALKLGACHHAGLAIRVAIIAMADGRAPARIRSTVIDSSPPVVTDQFAAHMQRCELIERAPPSTRLIGGTCLIDGHKCRESER